MLDIETAYEALPSIDIPGEAYSTIEVDGSSLWSIAKDKADNPAVIFFLSAPTSSDRIPVELRNLIYDPCKSVEICTEDRRRRETVALLKCISPDAELRRYFLTVLSPLLAQVQDSTSEDQIGALIRKIVELFQALDLPARSSLQGLWCELMLIAQSNSLRQAVRAWHPSPRSLYDFTVGRESLEVKSTATPLRAHQFSLSQLTPPTGTSVTIASILLEDHGRGSSIRDLWEQIKMRDEMTSQLRERTDQILTMALGRDWRRAERVVFDVDQAIQSLRLYRVEDIPRIGDDLPPEVSDVRFKVELTDVTPISGSARPEAGSLMHAFLGDK